MDGLQGRLNRSVQAKLSVTLSLAILAVAVVAGVFAFILAFDEAHELQDDMLRQVATLVDRQPLPAAPLSGTLAPVRGRLEESEEESRVIVQRLGIATPASPAVDAGGPLPIPAAGLADGLHTLRLGGETFRVLIRTTAFGERVAVAQEASFRDGIARASALRTMMPFLVLVPVLLLVVADLVRKLFHPIAALSREVDRRAEQELHPLEAGNLPTEIRPFVVAINRLLARVAQAMEVQRRFVADAAHELRSPLAALSLQAERLAETELPAPARERLGVLRGGLERSRNLLNQLLALARVQSQAERPETPVSAQGVYRRVLEDLLPLAEARRLDLGVEGDQDAQVWMAESDLVVLVRNLVDNAIRYTPEGGRIDLSVEPGSGGAVLSVQDTGPGIPPGEREQVFAPFHRLAGSLQPGSGLGLAIVKAVAERYGAEVRLDFGDRERQSGLRVSVAVPGAPPADRVKAVRT